MSRFFNRIGTKAMKYEFEFEIQRVKLAVDKSYNIIIILKRGYILLIYENKNYKIKKIYYNSILYLL
jgi:hypothetical protein